MHLSFSSILLFSLVIPVVMMYRISSGETPYWLFGIIFILLLGYVALDLSSFSKKLYFRLKEMVLWLVILSTLGASFYSAIVVRHKTAPEYNVHDIILQQEAAIRYFVNGKNPYKETYFGTPLEKFHYSDSEVNPALYHFVMEPFYLLSSLPVYVLANQLFGYFDGRMTLVVLLAFVLVLARLLTEDKEKRLEFITLLAFNPAMYGYTLEGRSDIHMYAFLFFAFYLLHKKKTLLAGIPMGMAFAIKQSVWPLLPFYVAYLFFKNRSIIQTLRQISLFVVTFLIFTAPFFIWDSEAFINSTISYLSGTTEHSYPVSGYGFGMLLSEIGLIKDLHAYYPFIIWQLGIGVPLLFLLLLYLKKNPTIIRMILAYTFFLFVYWYFSRYFNNSHLGYLSLLFITAYFWPQKKGVNI